MKRGRKATAKFKRALSDANNQGQKSSWYQSFRNLIHYSQFYNKKLDITLEQLDEEIEREQLWMSQKKDELEAAKRLDQIFASVPVFEDREKVQFIVDNAIRECNKRYNDSLEWFTFLNQCAEEYRTWEEDSQRKEKENQNQNDSLFQF